MTAFIWLAAWPYGFLSRCLSMSTWTSLTNIESWPLRLKKMLQPIMMTTISVGTMYLSDNNMICWWRRYSASGDLDWYGKGLQGWKKSGSKVSKVNSVTINGGNVDVYATDDGVNAANANASQSEIFKMTGGTLKCWGWRGLLQTQSILTAMLLYRWNDQSDWSGSGLTFDGSATYTGGDTINGGKQPRLKTQCLNKWPQGGGGPAVDNAWLWRRSLKSHRMKQSKVPIY